jgi:O-antigen/teichoic acid export membrane protein
MKPVRDLLKHSSIYAIGQILTRMASIMLLPLYTYCLTPADYGVTAILDLTTTILALLIGGGMVTAVTRFHFDNESDEHHDRVWWTGLTYVTVVASIVLFPMWLGRQLLSDLTLGAGLSSGPYFYTLALITTWLSTIACIFDTYLRVKKWSGVFVVISMGRLLLNITLNVWFLVGLKLGVEGLLIGNLIATTAHTLALFVVFLKSRGAFSLDRELARQLVRFSMPLVATALLSMLMHEADRYVLRAMVGMDEVGVYSLAHKIGFAVNTLCLLPFSSIWHVAIYDIERLPDARQVFSRIFGWFTSGLGILLLGASLCVHPVLPLLTPESYGEAVDLISVILLGFYLFGLSYQFEVPALLTKRSMLMLPGSVAGVVVNIAANVLLIPVIGAWGAAWAGVLTYLVYSLLILAACRTAMTIQYPWVRSTCTTLGLCLSYVALRYGCFPYLNLWSELLASIAVCGLWAIALFGNEALQWWAIRGTTQETDTAMPTAAVSELEQVIG